jgi:hypothetical protein
MTRKTTVRKGLKVAGCGPLENNTEEEPGNISANSNTTIKCKLHITNLHPIRIGI